MPAHRAGDADRRRPLRFLRFDHTQRVGRISRFGWWPRKATEIITNRVKGYKFCEIRNKIQLVRFSKVKIYKYMSFIEY